MGIADTAGAPSFELECISFGEFELFPTRRALFRGGATVAIGSRAFDLLSALLERPGEILSQRELLSRGWPGLVVQESNLRVHIVGLRKLLGRRDDGTSFIANVPGRGYAFTGATTSQRRAAEDHQAPKVEATRRREPAPSPTHTVGRDEDIATITALIEQKRLVSIVGFGGLGKTTCAIAVASARRDSFPGGIHFVDLSGAGPFEAADKVAGALRLDISDGTLSEKLLAATNGDRTLLVLDNCEPVAASAADICESLLSVCPELVILTTSRERLRAMGEHLYLLQPLSLPSRIIDLTAAEALQAPAIKLFMTCAEAGGYACPLRDDEAPLVAQICSELDGIPLAIECVASRASLYGIHGIADALDRVPTLPWSGRRNATQRHQSLLLNARWSFETLIAIDCHILQALKNIEGPFSLIHAIDTATMPERSDIDVAAAIERLCDKSLIWREQGRGLSRYRIPKHIRKMPISLPVSEDRNVIPLKSENRHTSISR